MSLVQKTLRNQVPGSIRKAGQAYFDENRVLNIEDIDDNTIEATVRGTRIYTVNINQSDGDILYSCTCPFYRQNLDVCKHVWATLIKADELAMLLNWDRLSPDPILSPADDDDIEDPLDDVADDSAAVAGPINERRIRTATQKHVRKSNWKRELESVRSAMETQTSAHSSRWVTGRQIQYVIDVARTMAGGGLAMEIAYRDRKKDGNWSKLKHESLSLTDINALPDPADREVAAMLTGASAESWGGFYSGYQSTSSRYRLAESQLVPIVRRTCQTGRCVLRPFGDNDPELIALQWDDGAPWKFVIRVSTEEEAGRFIIRGQLTRPAADGSEQISELSESHMLVSGGLVFFGNRAAPLDDSGAFPWIILLRAKGELTVPIGESEELLKELLSVPRLPPMQLPSQLRYDRIELPPKPQLRIIKPKRAYWYSQKLEGQLSFDYGGHLVPFTDDTAGIFLPEQRRMIVRNRPAEHEALARLLQLGFRQSSAYYDDEPSRLELSPNNLPIVVRKLTAENWHIEAEGKLYRQPGEIKIEVSSGIDWFELHGSADFDGQSVKLPALLAALRKGDKSVVLGDGSLGVLPEEWLRKYGALAGMGTEEGDHLQFRRSQIGLLDALLASQPEASCDAVFEQARRQLLQFQGVRAADPPAGFIGTLRTYQREGLGWINFLREFGFGGCLADDMGLGKTVQVLALLEDRREQRAALDPQSSQRRGPSLVVAPRSLIFNWREEAGRFAPRLRLLDQTGMGRAKSTESFNDFDLILTTYGTLRNDAAMLKDFHFDYLILDEAQAIKNASSESAKAARLLNGGHRLVLSGTPVQNHLGELWSIFEFLNPGMLGSARAFQSTGAGARVVEDSTRQVLAKALRPFILRRTKSQVARDLPERVEQTIHCELDAKQRKQYDELREHYRKSLLEKVERDGIGRSKIQILEALLRLRQAACHPGLIDKTKTGLGSAKLDSLLPTLAEVTEEGHKALVFSQFTSFLAIVRDRLDKQKIPYEYLDGRTRNRQEVVERFQKTDNSRLFLISLKAGGLGLNLTAAEYVFLLDPWWNPAVEAQAIDRARRIGQTQQVFAYRLIAKDTVEEKVLKLQETKRELADAIINADNSIISKLGREELELLLS